MKRCMELATRPVSEGPLKPIIPLGEGKSQIVLGFNPKAGVPEVVKGDALLQQLGDIQLLRATVGLGKDAVLDARATMESEEKAQGLQAALNLARGLMAPFALAKMKNRGGDDAKLAQQLSKLLRAVEIETDGKDLVVKARIGTRSLVPTLILVGKQATKK
jgi:hypothetical protein